MKHDTKLPSSLKRTQEWFTSIVSRPIDGDSQMNPLSPSGVSMEIEAAEYILPSHTMLPHLRIEIYNQQIWWRFLSVLHETFPFTLRLFGYYDFNQKIGIPYLVKYPSDHWSLSLLGNRLAQWVTDEYHGEDKEFVLDAVRLDFAYTYSFIAPQCHPLNMNIASLGNLSEILEKKIHLQPHVFLFELEADLFDCRTKFLREEPGHWIDNEFPELKQNLEKYYFVLFRNSKNTITYQSTSEGEYRMLEQFKESNTLEAACNWLEKQKKEIQSEAGEKLHFWLKNWILNQWLTVN